MNDPRSPYKLRTQDLDLFPVYLRLEGTDHWKLLLAVVHVYSGADAASMQRSDWLYSNVEYTGNDGGLWLGPKAGKWLHLRRIGRPQLTRFLKSAKLLEAVNKRLPPARPSRRRK